jgi:uncharacterized protein YhbP (UPF0306 family)
MDTEKLVRDCLSKCIHMSLGTCADNKPWVCEVHFAYDGELNLYYRSLTSRRHSQEIEKNKYVAGNVVKQYAKGEPCDGAVYFEGTAKLLTPGQELDAAHKALSERLGIGDAELQQAQDPAGHQYYKVSVDKFYFFGILDKPPAQKLELDWAARS